MDRVYRAVIKKLKSGLELLLHHLVRLWRISVDRGMQMTGEYFTTTAGHAGCRFCPAVDAVT